MHTRLLETGACLACVALGFWLSRAYSRDGVAVSDTEIDLPAAALQEWFPPIGDFDTGGEPLGDEQFDVLMTALDHAMTAEETLADFEEEADLHLWSFMRRLANPEVTEEQRERASAYLTELEELHPEHSSTIGMRARLIDSYASPFPTVPPFAGAVTFFRPMSGYDTDGAGLDDAQVDELLATLDALLTIPETLNDFDSEARLHFWRFGARLQAGGISDEQTARIVAYLDEVKAEHPESAESIDRDRFLIEHLTPGRIAPNIVGTDTDGVEFALEEYRGDIVVLLFSGQWCGPCRVEYPYHRFMLEHYEDQPVVLLGINSDEELETIRQAKIDERLPYRTWWDGHGEKATGGPIATEWNVTAWPSIYVLDEEGVIRSVGKRGGELISAVDQLLAERRMREYEAEAAGAAEADAAKTSDVAGADPNDAGAGP